jgi:hypothetical protein
MSSEKFGDTQNAGILAGILMTALSASPRPPRKFDWSTRLSSAAFGVLVGCATGVFRNPTGVSPGWRKTIHWPPAPVRPVHCAVTINCENRVMTPIRAVKPMDGTAVRCEADRCEVPALFLFVASGVTGERWAYCEEHARRRARTENLKLPLASVATAGAAGY